METTPLLRVDCSRFSSNNSESEWILVRSVNVAGNITKVRIYTNSTETGAHNVRIWNASTGRLAAGPFTWTITSGTAEWKEYTHSSLVNIAANTEKDLKALDIVATPFIDALS